MTKMTKKLPLYVGLLLVICLLGMIVYLPPQASAQESQENYISVAYFTGVGCPHCARGDPLVLDELPGDYPNLIILEYEIYDLEQNAPLFEEYSNIYDAGFEIPMIIIGPEQYLTSDITIIKNAKDTLDKLENNPLPLIDGSSQNFQDVDLSTLPGYPKIWHKNKIALKIGAETDSTLLKNLLLEDDLPIVLEGEDYIPIEPEVVKLSGKDLKFDNAILVGDWVFQWNGDRMGIAPAVEGIILPDETLPEPAQIEHKVTLAKIISLALVDAVNPCAFAVLLLLLTAILAYNPGNKRSILLAGLMFISAVFVMYFIYGLVFIKFFQLIQTLNVVKIWLFRALAVAAIIFGILNIRDFLKYKPGGLGTEMPLMLRPRMQAVIARVTSPRGAFITGIFVTVFLLPCTIGPYIIAAGILSVFDMLANIPVLLLYNLIFILPMMAIVAIVYFGLSGVKDVEEWKNRHITKLHLIAGILMLFVGVALLMGWV
jgi:cytochrome c biogenesis protein CcdA